MTTKIRVSIAAAIVGLSLGGCAIGPSTPWVSQEALDSAAAPIHCANPGQCKLYWQRAQVAVTELSDYKIQTSTDSVIQTYGPMEGENAGLAFQLTKLPGDDGSATISILAQSTFENSNADDRQRTYVRIEAVHDMIVGAH